VPSFAPATRWPSRRGPLMRGLALHGRCVLLARSARPGRPLPRATRTAPSLPPARPATSGDTTAGRSAREAAADVKLTRSRLMPGGGRARWACLALAAALPEGWEIPPSCAAMLAAPRHLRLSTAFCYFDAARGAVVRGRSRALADQPTGNRRGLDLRRSSRACSPPPSRAHVRVCAQLRPYALRRLRSTPERAPASRSRRRSRPRGALTCRRRPRAVFR